MKTNVFVSSRINYDIARRAITKTCLLLRKQAKLNRKEAAKLLGISDYALEHYEGLHIMPPCLLSNASIIYKATCDEFLNTSCELISNKCENYYDNKNRKIGETDKDIYMALYNELKTAWENATEISTEILDQWIGYTNIYYVYFILIRQRFIKYNQYEFMKQHKLSMIELWFIAFYDIPLELLEGVNNIPIWIMYYKKEMCECRKEREVMDHNIKLISLVSHIR